MRQEWVGSRLQEGGGNFLLCLSPSSPRGSFACHGLEDEDGARSWKGALPIGNAVTSRMGDKRTEQILQEKVCDTEQGSCSYWTVGVTGPTLGKCLRFSRAPMQHSHGLPTEWARFSSLPRSLLLSGW